MITRALFRVIYTVVLLVVFGFNVYAKKERFYNSLEGWKGQLKVDSVMLVADVNTLNANSWNSYLVLRLNELYGSAGTAMLADSFTVSVRLLISYNTFSRGSSSPLLKDTTLQYSYNKLRSSNPRLLQDLGANNYVQVKIGEVTVSGADPSRVLPYLMLESYIDADRTYTLNCSANLVSDLKHADPSAADADEIGVTWKKLNEADEYDLEWAWVDQVALDGGSYGAAASPDLNLVFANNASRVNLQTEGYKIPLLYDDKGVLFYRVRPVQYDPNGQRKTGMWSVAGSGGNGSGRYSFGGHQRKLNWQASTSFAEEGKRKSVVQYFDGSLKNRQTVTKDNTTNTTVVAETLYDRQGRPTIQVLPAPTLSSIIKYSPVFTQTINNTEYDKNAYDRIITPSDYCATAAPAMGTQSGASQYYSPANPDNSRPFNKFIADASRYPFTETRYTADNTGRIAAQSGVGPVHQLGSGRETRYYYGNPSQEQLDALFGSEAGYANFYQKTMVRDANGQYSVSYTDMSGKTVATALAGDSTGNTDTLPSYKTQFITENLLTKENTYIEEKSIISNSSIVVPKAGVHEFKYAFKPEVLQGSSAINPPGVPICYDCLYDLEITLSTDCNNQGLPGDKPMVIRKTNVGVGLPDSICGDSGPQDLNTDFEIFLPEGVTNITKKLSVSQQSMDRYREIYLRHNTYRTRQSFIDQWTDSIRLGTPCNTDSTSCVQIGNLTQQEYIQKYIATFNLAADADQTPYINEATATYEKLKKECADIADGYVEDNNLRELMLADMTPPSGQYARPSNHRNDPGYDPADNTTWPQAYGIFTSLRAGTTIFRVPVYKDQNGSNQLFYENGTATDISVVSEEAFIDGFQSQWAESLLEFHPEYDRLVRFESYRLSHKWNEAFENTQTYTEALSRGYITPLGSISGYSALPSGASVVDPFFINQSYPYAGEPGLLNDFRNQINNYKSITVVQGQPPVMVSLWQFINLTIKCPNSTQGSACFDGATTKANVFNPAYLCADDLQMAWTMFKNLYLQEKKDYVNREIFKIPQNPPGSVTAPAQTRFISSNDVYSHLGTSPGQLTSYISQQTAVQAESTCRSYAEFWTQQLAPCNFSKADHDSIIAKMIEVCKRGYDIDHPLGASSVNPTLYPGYAPSNFIEIIARYALASGKDPKECNGYLIDAPKPYNIPAFVGERPIIEKPDECTCNRLGQLNTEASAQGYSGNLSGYLKVRYQTEFSQGKIDTLLAKCNSSADNCRFLPAAINIPPVLQCLPTPVCISCEQTKLLKDSFLLTYPGALLYQPADAAGQAHNKLFAKYMNYRTGFGYTHTEYLQFLESCPGYTPDTTCTNLEQLLGSFSYQGKEPIHMYNALTGCDTARWVSNLPGRGKLQGTPISEQIINGAFVPKADASGDHFSTIDYYDTVCIGNKLVFETRLKMPRTGHAFNPFANDTTIFSFTNDFYFRTLQGANEHVDLAVNNYNGITELYYVHASVGQAGPINFPQDLSEYRVVKVEVTPTTYRYYLDGVFVAQFAHQTYTHMLGYDFAAYASSFSIDWMKISDEHGQELMFEDFENGCSGLAQITRDPCTPDCRQAFTAYFNQQRGSAYTYQEIEEIYLYQCGKVLDPCAPEVVPNVASAAAPSPTLSNLMLCGRATPDFPEVPVITSNPCSDVEQLGIEKGTFAWMHYTDSISNDFDRLYLAKCMDAARLETFTVTHNVAEYHYTLYYYDRAGNLVRTVPPASVTPNYSASWLAAAKAARENHSSAPATYGLATEYRYNSLNQVVAQKTPDAGISHFWYDRIGRLVVSQNAKQAPLSQYSYTLYDELGRITEVGQKENHVATVTQQLTRNPFGLYVFINHQNNTYPPSEVTRTFYDQLPLYNMANKPVRFVQQPYTLRNRVSYTQFFDRYYYSSGPTNPVDLTRYTTATYYNYDIHGNVKQLLNHFYGSLLGSTSYKSNQFKLIEYDYDLISGKVNQVSYQPTKVDQFYHRYVYDAENRITDVFTTTNPLFVGNSYLEDHDAYYQYYKHGPLARTVLGEQQVQGTDFAYTLQGWLKGINSTAVKPNYDMGEDGTQGSITARDAYGFGLYYFTDESSNVKDYTPINGSIKAFADWNYLPGIKPLYNGNIRATSLHVPSIGDPLLYRYNYDQLNRLTAMNAFTKTDMGLQNSWSSAVATANYKEQVTYDANGNILKYKRNGTTAGNRLLDMDSMVYHYTPGTNRLDHITDSVAAGNYNEDIDNQAPGNYGYDNIGNLTRDSAENITGIEWTVYGKIKKITKDDGTTIEYQYGTDGNRITKTVTKDGVSTATAYVRDAQGNVMAIYVSKSGTLRLEEQDIYGSSRLGVYKPGLDVSVLDSFVVNPRIRGNTFYELSNHLGNVLVTISDKKIAVASASNSSVVDHYMPQILTANDYYPFGMLMPGRHKEAAGEWGPGSGGTSLPVGQTLSVNSRAPGGPKEYKATREIIFTDGFTTIPGDEFIAYITTGNGTADGSNGTYTASSTGAYRYGFNGMEKDNDPKGEGNSYTTEFRQYDPRVGRWYTVDPAFAKYSSLSTYSFSNNNPIRFVDPRGDDWWKDVSSGKLTWISGQSAGSEMWYQGGHYTRVGAQLSVNDLGISHIMFKVYNLAANNKYRTEDAQKQLGKYVQAFGKNDESGLYHPAAKYKGENRVNMSSLFEVNEKVNPKNFYDVVMGGFLSGTGSQNLYFDENHSVSKSLENSGLFMKGLSQYMQTMERAGRTNSNQYTEWSSSIDQPEYKVLGIMARGIVNDGTALSPEHLIGSAYFTFMPSADHKTLNVRVFNVTTANSGGFNGQSFPRPAKTKEDDPGAQPFTNVSQTFDIKIPLKQ